MDFRRRRGDMRMIERVEVDSERGLSEVVKVFVMRWLYPIIPSYIILYYQVALSLSLHLILSGGFILFLKDIFHLIAIWSCGHYYKVQGWAHSKHMPDTCLPHIVYMYYCTLLCSAVCTSLFYCITHSFSFYLLSLSFNLYSHFILLINHAFHLLISVIPAYLLLLSL